MINRFGRLIGRIVLSLVVFLAIPLLGWNAFPKFMLDGDFGNSRATGTGALQVVSAQSFSAGNVQTGQKLFMGNIHFENEGPPCMGCHNIGAFGLVLGPWLGGTAGEPFTVLGLILHMGSTIWLIVLMVRAFRKSGRLNSAGAWHLVSSYLWIAAPVFAAPLILFGVLEAGPVEATAPQALIYGWVLQFGIALVPFIARRFFLKQENPQLGGCWGSLAAATLGSLLVWASIFIMPVRGVLYGIGFALYTLSLIHPVKELLEIARDGLQARELA